MTRIVESTRDISCILEEEPRAPDMSDVPEESLNLTCAENNLQLFVHPPEGEINMRGCLAMRSNSLNLRRQIDVAYHTFQGDREGLWLLCNKRGIHTNTPYIKSLYTCVQHRFNLIQTEDRRILLND